MTEAMSATVDTAAVARKDPARPPNETLPARAPARRDTVAHGIGPENAGWPLRRSVQGDRMTRAAWEASHGVS